MKRGKIGRVESGLAMRTDELDEARVAAATLERVRTGREKVYTASEAKAELDVHGEVRRDDR